MAIVFDAAGGAGRGFGNTTNWAHVIGANEHRILEVEITLDSDIVTGVTFAGLPMDFVGSIANGAFLVTYLYGMVSPPIGANNVVATFGGNTGWACSSVSYDGVDPLNTYGTVVTNVGNDNTPTVNAASVAGEVVIDSMGFILNSNRNVGALQTDRSGIAGGGGLPGNGASDEPGQAVVTMSWTIVGGVARWATVAVPLRPFASTRGRATKYFFPFWDANPKLFDANGKIVDPSDILADEWVEAEGLGFPTAENPDSFIEDPSRSKIIEVNATQASARMKTNINQFAETLVSRVAAGS